MSVGVVLCKFLLYNLFSNSSVRIFYPFLLVCIAGVFKDHLVGHLGIAP